MLGFSQFQLKNEIENTPSIYILETSKIFSPAAYHDPQVMKECIDFAKQYASKLASEGIIVLPDEVVMEKPTKKVQIVTFDAVYNAYQEHKNRQINVKLN